MNLDYRNLSLDNEPDIPFYRVNKIPVPDNTRCTDCYFFKNEFCLANNISLSGNTASCTDFIHKKTDLSGKTFIRDELGNMRIVESYDIPVIQADIIQSSPGKEKLKLSDIIASDDNTV